MDLDFFKKINDNFGHHVGDIVLKETAILIKTSLSEEDIVARWGGEEFIFYFPNKSLTESLILLNKLKDTISSHLIKVDNVEITVTASFGVTEFLVYTEQDYINTFKLADEALYKAKNNGRNIIVTISNKGGEND